MKIRVEREALADAVAWVARSLPNRPTAPILAGMLLEADASGLTLSSFDSTTSAKVTVPANVTDEGTVLVSGRLLNEIARSLPNKPVELHADHSRVELTCGQARFTLQTLPVEEYPTLPDMPTQISARTTAATGPPSVMFRRSPSSRRLTSSSCSPVCAGLRGRSVEDVSTPSAACKALLP